MNGCYLPVDKCAHYMVHPADPQLSENQKKAAWISLLVVSVLTIGTVPLGIIFYEKFKNKDKNNPETDPLLNKVDEKVQSIKEPCLSISCDTLPSSTSTDLVAESNSSLIFTLSLPAEEECSSVLLDTTRPNFSDLTKEFIEEVLNIFLKDRNEWTEQEYSQIDILRSALRESVTTYTLKVATIHDELRFEDESVELINEELHVSAYIYHESLYLVQQTVGIYYQLLKFSPFPEDQELTNTFHLIAILGKEEFKKIIDSARLPLVVITKPHLDSVPELLAVKSSIHCLDIKKSTGRDLLLLKFYLTEFYTLFESAIETLPHLNKLYTLVTEPNLRQIEFNLLEGTTKLEFKSLKSASMIASFFFEDLYKLAYDQKLLSKLNWLLINICMGEDAKDKILYPQETRGGDDLIKIIAPSNFSLEFETLQNGFKYVTSHSERKEIVPLPLTLEFDNLTETFLNTCMGIFFKDKNLWTIDEIKQIEVISSAAMNSLPHFLQLAEQVFSKLPPSPIRFVEGKIYASHYQVTESLLRMQKLGGNFYKLLLLSTFQEHKNIIKLLNTIALMGKKFFLEKCFITASLPEIVAEKRDNTFRLEDLKNFNKEVCKINLRAPIARDKALLLSYEEGYYALLADKFAELSAIRKLYVYMTLDIEREARMFLLEESLQISDVAFKLTSYLCRHFFYELYELAFNSKLRRLLSWFILNVFVDVDTIKRITVPTREFIFQIESLKDTNLEYKKTEDLGTRYQRKENREVKGFDRGLLGTETERIFSAKRWIETGYLMHLCETNIKSFRVRKWDIEEGSDILSEVHFLMLVNFSYPAKLDKFDQVMCVSTLHCNLAIQCIKSVSVKLFEEIRLSPYADEGCVNGIFKLFKSSSTFDAFHKIRRTFDELFHFLTMFLERPEVDEDSLYHFSSLYQKFIMFFEIFLKIAKNEPQMAYYLELIHAGVKKFQGNAENFLRDNSRLKLVK